MSTKPHYTAEFRFVATAAYTPTDSECREARASLDKLAGLMDGVEPGKESTIVYVVGNLAVGGLVNLNDDALTLEDTLRIYPGFEHQQVNIEHNRGTIVGFVVKSGLSEFGTDRLITPEEARAAGKPVNIAIAVALWKVADRDLTNFVQQMSAPGSPDKGKLSFSFEVGFDDYSLVMMPRDASNLALASKVVHSDAPDFVKLEKLLRVNGGKGVTNTGERVARILGGNIVPLGAGIVTVPAAAVKGLVAVDCIPDGDQTDASLYEYSSTQFTLPESDAAPFVDYAKSIPDQHVYTDEGDPTLGREMESHCTVLYGIKGTDHTPIASCLAGFGPVTMTMGEVSSFSSENTPYDVLKVDVHSEDLHRLHHLIKTATATETTYPDYHPHLTIAYTKKGHAAGYVGDTRFKGKQFTFNHLTFSPHTGDRVEIPLTKPDSETQSETTPGPVYSPFQDPDPSMASSRYIKLSQGWQERLAALQANAGKDPLVNGVSVTLSDGRKLTNLKVFDGETLELDKELSMSGVVITDMTPGVGPQPDDRPDKANAYPTCRSDKVAQQLDVLDERHEARKAAYTDAAVKLIGASESEMDQASAALDEAMDAFAKDTKKPYGEVEYADPGYQSDKKKRYPIDTEQHIRAAWSYINHPKNAKKYTPEQVKHIKSRIISAWKSKIDKAGPESAKAGAVAELATDIARIVLDTIATQYGGPLSINTPSVGVSPTTPNPTPMNLQDLQQTLANVKTVEELPTVVANVKLFADEIAKASEKLAQERKDAQAAADAAKASVEQIKAQLTELQTKYTEMTNAQAAQAAAAKYQERMATIDEVFDLDDEVRAEIVDEVKACADDAAFDKWLSKAKKMMKGSLKKKGEKPGDKAKDTEPDDDDDDDDDAKAAKAAAEALASAAKNVVDTPINNAAPEAPESLKARYEAVFAKNITLDGTKVEDLIKKQTVKKTK